MSRSPVVARRRLGAALRELRTAAGLKLEDAARTLDCSMSKVSRLENGKGVPRHRDVRDLVELFGAAAREREDELMRLVADSLSAGEGLVTDFRDVFEGAVVSNEVSRYLALEQDATAISAFEPFLVPGLLQTAEFAEAVVGFFYPERSRGERRRLVDLRMQRQEVLRRPGKGRLRFAVVIAEQALRRPIGGPAVMRKQLEHLAGQLRDGLSEVEFRVAPLDLVHAGVLGGPFAVLRFADEQDQDVVYLEGRDGATYLETEEQVRRYGETFAALLEACPDRAGSIAIVERAAELISS
ncbi:helix-turn-helix domain-containing protein [Pseudonocardia sichuanensis]